LTVDDSLVTVFSEAASGLEGSDLTSTLRVLLLDSEVVTGAGVAGAGEAGAAAGAAVAAAAVGGACWQPVSVSPSAVMAKAIKSLQEYGFIWLGSLFVLHTFVVQMCGRLASERVRHETCMGIGQLKEHRMSILTWIVLGLLAGFIGSKLVNKTGEGVVLDIVLGIVGAVVGGFLFSLFGASGVTGLNLYSVVVAVIGAMLLLIAYHAIRRRNLSWYRR
jgi:uncharacterized membrane protein YeaQ/YmgE (transglycosylase-associated protein family)